MKPPKPPPPGLELVFEGPWPHEFFKPAGLACRSFTGNVALLVAEKYAVHELRPEQAALRSAEVDCLAQSPRFQARGIQGITVECTNDEAQCTTLLMGATGTTALRCANGTRPAQEVRLFGGPWRTGAASSDSKSLWALAMRGPTLLEPNLHAGTGSNFSQDMVPSMELEVVDAEPAIAFDRLEGGGLLGLSADGEMRSWLPSRGGTWRPAGWSNHLPKSLGLRWSGFCMAGRAAYLVGMPAGKAAAGTNPQIWKWELPATEQD
eukprot:CAMPEP_0197679954 /NCGR_PEP_ID=MMETSP1338-20131121/92499_1 /TAXON_ID=43686 ORGANISM="Pelagodinium beii, Strain RCC1491" /NCGR_SAMPLE_ID=MMETSP1338 /ASSEMBLY_ACC=CAM_ASM_000754 /LENGTH=263 /DNA_ID=CAMNT_0043261073 /DNA_START=11 /DNA_END=802 /DNA_ORIENTATION=-